MLDILIVGATRGLGASLVKKYAAVTEGIAVYATSRSEPTSKPVSNVRNISGVDLTSKDAGSTLASALKQHGAQIETVIITAGYFGTETFDEPKWEDEIKMYVLQTAVWKKHFILTGQSISLVFTKFHTPGIQQALLGPSSLSTTSLKQDLSQKVVSLY